MKKSALVEDMEHCLICKSPYVEVHHVFFGTANRKISDKYGYVVPLCARHHRGNAGVHQNRLFDLRLKKMAQKHFEREFGTREDFIATFGKSYL